MLIVNHNTTNNAKKIHEDVVSPTRHLKLNDCLINCPTFFTFNKPCAFTVSILILVTEIKLFNLTLQYNGYDCRAHSATYTNRREDDQQKSVYLSAY